MTKYLEPIPGTPPYPEDVIFDDTHLLLTRAQYNALPVYDMSLPTGVVPGKTWRCGALIGRYDHVSEDKCRSAYRIPLIFEERVMDKIKLVTRSDSLHYLQYYNVCAGQFECLPRRGFSGAAADSWEWNGSFVSPSLAPSIRHTGSKGWHYHIENGRIRYLGDSPTGPEELVVDMVPIDEVGTRDVVIWTVYANPSDYPGKWVVRRWMLDKPGTWCFVAPSLEMARRVLPDHLIRLERWPTDDPCIVECWI